MNKEHFLIELKIYLKPLSIQQQKFFLDKYEAIFAEQIEAGQSEEQITKMLGKPKNIAKEILSDFNIAVPQKQLNRHNWQEIYPENNYFYQKEQENQANKQELSKPHHSRFVRFLQISGLLMFNFFCMIWVIFATAMLFFGSWLVSILFTISPILSILSSQLLLNDSGLFKLSLSILLCGMGIIGLLILVPLTKIFFKLLVKYLHWNIFILKGEI